MKAILLILLSGIFLQGMGENRQLYIITDSKQVAEDEKTSVVIPEDVVWIFDSSENTIKVCSDYDTTELNVLEEIEQQASDQYGSIHTYTTDFGTVCVYYPNDSIMVSWTIGNRTYRFYNN